MLGPGRSWCSEIGFLGLIHPPQLDLYALQGLQGFCRTSGRARPNPAGRFCACSMVASASIVRRVRGKDMMGRVCRRQCPDNGGRPVRLIVRLRARECAIVAGTPIVWP